MKLIRHCCFIGCDKLAEWEIVYGNTLDDYTDACTEHVGALLTDAPSHTVYPIHNANYPVSRPPHHHLTTEKVD